jgi:hypothetical protein
MPLRKRRSSQAESVEIAMSFRRSKTVAQESRAWQDFLQANAALFHASGVPISVYQSRDLFDDLLMHGYIDHHPDPTRFFVSQLSDAQREALVEVAVRYLRAGFADLGIGGFPGGPTRDEIFRRVQQEAVLDPTRNGRGQPGFGDSYHF